MQKLRHNIFGKSVVIDIPDTEIHTPISREFSLYPAASGDTDLLVSVTNGLSIDAISQNPSIHRESTHAILLSTLLSDIRLDFKGPGRLSEIHFSLNKNPNLLRKYTQKLIDIQFTSREERVGQILHEQVLTPWAFFLHDRIPVHAAAVQGWSGKAILIGGSGGVGKTSLELELCMNHGYRFLADDMSILSTAGNVYPHLNFPKIYGYNQTGDRKLAGIVRSGRSAADNLHWHAHRFLRGASGVRRRVSPVDLYGGYATREAELGAYYLLVRTDVKQIEQVSIAPEKLARLSVNILRTEYDWFFRHLYWHELNRTAMDMNPLIEPDELFRRWESSLATVLRDVSCQLVRIPMALSHADFKNQMADRIRNG